MGELGASEAIGYGRVVVAGFPEAENMGSSQRLTLDSFSKESNVDLTLPLYSFG